MGRDRVEPIRPSKFKSIEKFYILAFEGVKTEPKYFRDLRNSDLFIDDGTIMIEQLKRPKNIGNDPVSIKKLLKYAKENYGYKKSDEYWMIIDFDDWKEMHHIDLDKLAQECNDENNFFMALSNPCFEIWLLLHLKSLEDYTDDEKEKLLANNHINTRKNYIDIKLGEAQNRGYNKNPNPRIYLPKIKDAILRAETLSNANEPFPTNLGSDVYKLVKKLIK